MIAGMSRTNPWRSDSGGRGSADGCLAAEVRRFLAAHHHAALFESGEPLLLLEPGRCSVEERGGRVVLEAWDERRSFSRRLSGVASLAPGRLELHTERFGNRRGRLVLSSRRGELARRAGRDCALAEFGERLSRQFPGVDVEILTSGPDLEHSLSPAYPRALLRHAGRTWAAIGAPVEAAHPENVLTFGLIWLDYVRRRRNTKAVSGLAVFLPEQAAASCCLRVRHLDRETALCRVFACAAQGGETEVDPLHFGNVATRLERAAIGSAGVGGGGGNAEDEHRLELLVREKLETIDAELLPAPVYRQASGITGCDRGIPDLLAVDRSGRLAVIELKASEDIHLPLQALDYWIRAQWHLDRGEFAARGYFPGMELRKQAPRLLLIAPAFAFHPAHDIVLRFFDPTIQVTRLGLGLQWRKELKVVFRKDAGRRNP